MRPLLQGNFQLQGNFRLRAISCCGAMSDCGAKFQAARLRHAMPWLTGCIRSTGLRRGSIDHIYCSSSKTIAGRITHNADIASNYFTFYRIKETRNYVRIRETSQKCDVHYVYLLHVNQSFEVRGVNYAIKMSCMVPNTVWGNYRVCFMITSICSEKISSP